jgi:hypothetical protein
MMALWDQICVAGSSEVCEVERPRDRGVCRDRRKPEVPPKFLPCQCDSRSSVEQTLPLARNQPRTGIPPTITGLGLLFFALSASSFHLSPPSTVLPDHSLLTSLVDEL